MNPAAIRPDRALPLPDGCVKLVGIRLKPG